MKVFGIGFHKTGTTSLGTAFKELGFSVTGAQNVHSPDIAETYLEITCQLSHEYDAFQDNPWPLVYREMDAMWPDAKFVLTVREPEQWIQSQMKHFGATSTPMRELIYGAGKGAPIGNETHYIQRVKTHNAAVRDHFAGRPDKLLEMEFAKGDGWKELCGFLNLQVPDKEFPHRNRADLRKPKDRTTKLMGKRLKGMAKRIAGRALSAGKGSS